MPVKSDLDKSELELQIEVVKRELDVAREDKDALGASLLEEALNDLLDRYSCNT